eukprot:tig00021070_g17861.t1
MRQLEFICLNMQGPADISALLPLAGSLRQAIINQEDLGPGIDFAIEGLLDLRSARLASDVPSLQKLTVKSPLPLGSAGGFVAVSSLKRLRRLVIKGAAAAALDDFKREALRGALLHVQISYEY